MRIEDVIRDRVEAIAPTRKAAVMDRFEGASGTMANMAAR
jgi:hypothetical protein